MSGIVKHGIYMYKGKLYRLSGITRDVVNPTERKVVYEQLYDSHLQEDPSIKLPQGTMWVRNVDDFRKKFILCLDRSDTRVFPNL